MKHPVAPNSLNEHWGLKKKRHVFEDRKPVTNGKLAIVAHGFCGKCSYVTTQPQADDLEIAIFVQVCMLMKCDIDKSPNHTG